MSDTVWIVVLTAVVNGAVVWGVVRTELKYLRRDVDHAHKRLDDGRWGLHHRSTADK